MSLATISASDVAKAVAAFNSIYGEMERALWRVSRAAREPLLRRRESTLVGALAWTIKSWWGVQGVRSEIRAISARALASLEWTEAMFEERTMIPADGEHFARTRVPDLVSSMIAFGAKRREFSLASKTLHWLMPWRIPVYDSFVRDTVGVPKSWADEDAYREIVRREYEVVRRLSEADSGWTGETDPRSPFRAIDKYLWWLGGGNAGRAVVVKRPWDVVYRLGLEPDSF